MDSATEIDDHVRMKDTLRSARWQQEAAHFDAVADSLRERLVPVSPAELDRYGSPRLRGWFSKEFKFRLFGDLHGKRVLDVGCGDGENAMLLARLGADVTGIDVSPRSIEVCAERARINGVAGRIRFVCAPLETAELPAASFDIVACQGILHHVIPELERVIRRIAGWTRPGGLVLISEPINLMPLFRRLRRYLPPTEHTPGERPLERAELDIIRKYLPDLRMRRFQLLERIERFFLRDQPYEERPLPMRLLANGIAMADQAILSLPLAADMAGLAVMYGSPR